ncbi:MAG: hypothetical protein HYZ83_06315, partial [Candidatus Omnitrophica bacterium]|nr:hypothetical protein [Candidatus Omnitrophota bacterium]
MQRYKKCLALLVLVPLFISSGCVAWKPLASRPAVSLPESYQGYYDYPPLEAGQLKAEIIGEKVTGSYVLRTVEFSLKLPAELEVKNLPGFKNHVEELAKTDQKTAKDLKLQYTNRIDYYLPKNLKPGQKRPVILISPILGGNMVVDHFAAYYAGRGYIAALVYRKRTFWDDEQGIEQVENYLRSSVIRLRQAVDWVTVQPEVDP